MNTPNGLLDLLNSPAVLDEIKDIPAVKALNEVKGLSHLQLTMIAHTDAEARFLCYHAIASEEFYSAPEMFLDRIPGDMRPPKRPTCAGMDNEHKEYTFRIEEDNSFWMELSIYNPRFDPAKAGWLQRSK